MQGIGIYAASSPQGGYTGAASLPPARVILSTRGVIPRGIEYPSRSWALVSGTTVGEFLSNVLHLSAGTTPLLLPTVSMGGCVVLLRENISILRDGDELSMEWIAPPPTAPTLSTSLTTKGRSLANAAFSSLIAKTAAKRARVEDTTLTTGKNADTVTSLIPSVKPIDTPLIIHKRARRGVRAGRKHRKARDAVFLPIVDEKINAETNSGTNLESIQSSSVVIDESPSVTSISLTLQQQQQQQQQVQQASATSDCGTDNDVASFFDLINSGFGATRNVTTTTTSSTSIEDGHVPSKRYGLEYRVVTSLKSSTSSSSTGIEPPAVPILVIPHPHPTPIPSAAIMAKDPSSSRTARIMSVGGVLRSLLAAQAPVTAVSTMPSENTL